MQSPEEAGPSGVGSHLSGSGRSSARNSKKPDEVDETNEESAALDQSILASAISSGMPTFLMTKGVSKYPFLYPQRQWRSCSGESSTVEHVLSSFMCTALRISYLVCVCVRNIARFRHVHVGAVTPLRPVHTTSCSCNTKAVGRDKQ